MQLSRRTLMRGGALGLGMLGVGAIGGCSTSAPGSGSSAGNELVLWTWPEGFGEEVLKAVASQFPDRSLRQDIIGGDFKQKLTTTFTAGSGLPDITGVKGEDIAFFRQHADYFVDLNTVGAQDLKSTYLEWKWAQATTADGRQLGIPIDMHHGAVLPLRRLRGSRASLRPRGGCGRHTDLGGVLQPRPGAAGRPSRHLPGAQLLRHLRHGLAPVRTGLRR